jgi:hypothetical protein
MSGPRSKTRDPQPDEQVEVEVVDLEPTLRGYHVAWNYSTRFWLPLLGPIPWAVWQTLLSFCFGGRDTCWPSISLIADIATGGNRNLITGRWRGRGPRRSRQPGALDALEEAGLLSMQVDQTGPQTRYTFHVLREPPLLTPDQLSHLSPRLRQLHADLLARCGIDQETYQHRVHNLMPRAARGITPAAQDSTPAAQGTTPAARGSTNHYKEQLQIEEVWRTIKEALKTEISPANYQTYLHDTHAIALDRNTGTLLVEASSPLIANQLNNYFAMTILRAAATTNASVHGVRIAAVHLIPRCPHVWDPAEHVHLS